MSKFSKSAVRSRIYRLVKKIRNTTDAYGSSVDLDNKSCSGCDVMCDMCGSETKGRVKYILSTRLSYDFKCVCLECHDIITAKINGTTPRDMSKTRAVTDFKAVIAQFKARLEIKGKESK